jgi:hypothetical protein
LHSTFARSLPNVHVWWGKHAPQPKLSWWHNTVSVALRGDWRTYRRMVLWVGLRYVGVQGKGSPLPKIDRQRRR